nr:MAG TPA: hypothetical protein [Caudoviricetes sp.]
MRFHNSQIKVNNKDCRPVVWQHINERLNTFSIQLLKKCFKQSVNAYRY